MGCSSEIGSAHGFFRKRRPARELVRVTHLIRILSKETLTYPMNGGITVFGKFVQLNPNRTLQTFALHHSIEGTFLLARTNFPPIGSFSS